MSSNSHEKKYAYEIRNKKRFHKSYDSNESDIKKSYYPKNRNHEEREKFTTKNAKSSFNYRERDDLSDKEKPRVRDRKSHSSSKNNSDYHRQSSNLRGSKKYQKYDTADLESGLTPNKLESLKKKKEKIEVLSMYR